MAQKLVPYALMAIALAVLSLSTIRIGVSIVSEAMLTKLEIHDVEADDVGSTPKNNDEPILPINARKLAVSKGEHVVSDVLPRLLQMTSEARKIEESQLPYQCGVIFFYHIPGTGGTVINDWLKELSEANQASYFSSSKEKSFSVGVGEEIRKLGSSDWRIIHAHSNSISLHADEHYMNEWREVVENQKCHFIATTTFQEPIDHSVSHTKKRFSECDCGMDEFSNELKGIMQLEQPWTGQLDYFLFNGERVPIISVKDKVKTGIQLLIRQFDLVLVDDHDKFSESILKITGWTSTIKMKKKVLDDGQLVFSKELVHYYGKIAAKSGDGDFIDAVNHAYHNYLEYLMVQ